MYNWLLTATWIGLTAAASAQPLPPYPDNSPTAMQWAQMYVPTPGPTWQLTDYQQLTKLLDQLLPLDKTTLPRADSPYSGVLFEQCYALPLPAAGTDFQTRLLAYERLKALPARFLLYYYEPNRRTQRFGAEVLRLHLAEWTVRRYGCELLREAPEELQSAQLLDYQREEEAAYTLAVESLLYLYEVEHDQYAPADLHDTARRLYYLVEDLPKGPLRSELAARLYVLAKNFPYAMTRDALKACYRACR